MIKRMKTHSTLSEYKYQQKPEIIEIIVIIIIVIIK